MDPKPTLDAPGQSSTPSSLDPSGDEIRDMGRQVVEWMATYLDGVQDRPVYPRTSAADLQTSLGEPVPSSGRSFDELFEIFREVIEPNVRHNAHPRSLGYVSAPGVAIAALADLLASTLNANVTAWRSAPAAAQLERVTIEWIRQALGLPEGTGGLFTSGGSMANLSALAAARYRQCGEEANAQGLQGRDKRLTVYISQEGHHSTHKAAAMLGIGHANVRSVAVDDQFRMDVADLVLRIEADLEAGSEPFCVVASAGTVVTGAIDPLAEIGEIARRFGLWFHIDGAYGGFASIAPSVRPRFAGLAQADSITLDPHKWLYLPVDCGCLLYRDPQSVRPTFALGADYTRVLEQEPDEAFAFWDYGPELSRRFRALKVWMTLAHVGTEAYAEAIEKDLDCARHLAQRVDESPDFERLAPIELSIVCFRYLPKQFRDRQSRTLQDEQALDGFNERLLVALQQAGSSYVSNANIRGHFALRACIVNFRTTGDDMEILLEDVRKAATLLEQNL